MDLDRPAHTVSWHATPALATARPRTAPARRCGPGQWEALRTSFFPLLKETMVHLLNADRYYIDTLRGERPGLRESRRAAAIALPSSRASGPGGRRLAGRFLRSCDRTGPCAQGSAIPWPEQDPHRNRCRHAPACFHARPAPPRGRDPRDALRDKRPAAPARRVHPDRRQPAARGGPRRRWAKVARAAGISVFARAH